MRDRDLPLRVYSLLVEDEDARVCRDIPDAACREQPRAFLLQWLAQSLTKLGDSLASSRLVLAWMLSSLGSPAFFISLLVPVRESLALLPQLFVASALRRHPRRKHFWVWGSVGQGIALALMAAAVMFLEGGALGVVVITLLALFSLARGVCSVAAKDVLGKTVARTRRGRLTGLSASVAGGITLLVAIGLMLEPGLSRGDQAPALLFAVILAVAAVLWWLAALAFAGIPEVPGSTEGGGDAIVEALASLSLLRTDRRFRDFVVARGLLISTAFAIPYLVVIAQQNAGRAVAGFAALMLAEGLAGLLSGPLWGRWSDVGANRVMAAAAALSLLAILATLALEAWQPAWLSVAGVTGSLLFLAAVSHHGVRVGRKTYLVDMASSDKRASYTAVSNTVIGVLLFAGGALGVVDAVYGTRAVLWLLSALALLAVWRSLRLPDVSG